MGGADTEHPVLDLLVERGANAIEHPGGTLLAHLRRVAALLDAWGAPDGVQTAGLCHACYGTDGFSVSLLGLDERQVLAARIGRRPEAWVYRYASCDRGAVYPELGTPGPLRFRDRFTGDTSTLSELEAAVLAEITAANELDLVTVNPAWGRRIGPDLLDLVRAMGPRLSGGARDAWNAWAVLSLTHSGRP
ncbi:MAG TPA: hypothetical protein VII76_11975 [Acidimicrobiales bacterium]